jgi:hypothetical protein
LAYFARFGKLLDCSAPTARFFTWVKAGSLSLPIYRGGCEPRCALCAALS